MAHVAATNMALQILDMAMQVNGAGGLSSDIVLAHLWTAARTLRIADGRDEVHLGTIAKSFGDNHRRTKWNIRNRKIDHRLNVSKEIDILTFLSTIKTLFENLLLFLLFQILKLIFILKKKKHQFF